MPLRQWPHFRRPSDTARARAAHKLSLSPDAAQMLVDYVGADLGRLDNELAKLAIDADPRQPVTPEKIAGNVAFQAEQEMWELSNALSTGDAAQALRQWRRLVQLDKSAEFRAVTWLGMWLEDVAAVLSGQSGKVAWKYKQRLPQLVRTAQQLGREGHSRALDLLAEIDHQSKTGVGDAAANVERFILELGAGVV